MCAKLTDYSLALMPQEVADLLDEIKNNWNFGKYQIPVVSVFPSWIGRMGETVILAGANTWALLTCTSDKTSRWVTMSNFFS